MQFPSSFPCRFFRQHFLHLGIALLLPLVTAFSLLSAPSPADAQDTKPPREREGGFEVQVPQSPALKAVKIGYIREIGDHPRPASRLDPVEPPTSESEEVLWLSDHRSRFEPRRPGGIRNDAVQG